ncbi:MULTISPECIES: WD40 repeat domain-containing protein [Ferrimonas]|uniref:YncE family protein n=1 Tax=Ferrimonas TaxID=44011 RepID=UPI0003FEC541|nr:MULTISPECIES: WD40 repeat domain-containing protein [Ferrimonas]USD39364.1 WD40 repeat domain-containing protein [Ferrimonas sp. SCSIO 43195]
MNARFIFAVLALLSPLTLAQPQTYDDAARWAFVSDRDSPTVAIVDTFNDTLVEHRQLKAIPIDMAVSDVQSLLVYIAKDDPKLYVWDLSDNRTWTLPLSFSPQSLKFHGDGAMLAVAGQSQVEIMEPLTRKVIKQIDQLSGPLSLNFSSDGYRLLITSEPNGHTTVWRVHRDTLSTLQMGSGSAVSEITLSPDSRLGLVSEPAHNRVHIWDFTQNKDWRWLTFNSPVQRPYVTSNSEHLLFVSDRGEIAILNAYSGQWVNRFQTEAGIRQIRTGWLERIGVVDAPSGFYVFNLTGDPNPRHFDAKGAAIDLVVVSDSKSMFSTTEGSQAISVLDLRKVKARSPIVTQLKQPNHIAMGLTNTICH